MRTAFNTRWVEDKKCNWHYCGHQNASLVPVCGARPGKKPNVAIFAGFDSAEVKPDGKICPVCSVECDFRLKREARLQAEREALQAGKNPQSYIGTKGYVLGAGQTLRTGVADVLLGLKLRPTETVTFEACENGLALFFYADGKPHARARVLRLFFDSLQAKECPNHWLSHQINMELAQLRRDTGAKPCA